MGKTSGGRFSFSWGSQGPPFQREKDIYVGSQRVRAGVRAGDEDFSAKITGRIATADMKEGSCTAITGENTMSLVCRSKL